MTVCLLLAAGSSSRMNASGLATPKMLLSFSGKTFLQHIIDEVKKTGNPLVVVTGCYHHLLQPVLEQQQIAFVQNESWNDGMGNSIQKGTAFILQHYPEVTSVIILVCDQPYLSAELLNKMTETKTAAQKGIVAAAYNNTLGIPVLFDRKYFEKLLSLTGRYGAKKIVQQLPDDTAAVAFEQGAIDIDTAEDYAGLVL